MLHVRYRSFVDEYRAHMERLDGWPREKFTRKWMRAHGGYAGGTYTAIRRGDLVPDKYVIKFVEMIATLSGVLETRQARATTLDFLGRFGIATLDPGNVEVAIGHLCGPPLEKPESARGSTDYLARGVDSLRELPQLATLDSHVRGCPDEVLNEVVRWLYVRVGQCTAADGPSMSHAAAIAYARAFMDIPESEYARRLATWIARSPWTCVRAWHKQAPVGMNVLLPVSARTYESVLAGERPGYECADTELEVPSLNFVLEAVAERPECLGDSRVNPTWPLNFALLLQFGALARCQRLSSASTFRIVSFAGTPKNRARMMGTGFRPTGRRMVRTQLEIFERTFKVGSFLTTDLIGASLLHLVGTFCPATPRMDDGP